MKSTECRPKKHLSGVVWGDVCVCGLDRSRDGRVCVWGMAAPHPYHWPSHFYMCKPDQPLSSFLQFQKLDFGGVLIKGIGPLDGQEWSAETLNQRPTNLQAQKVNMVKRLSAFLSATEMFSPLPPHHSKYYVVWFASAIWEQSVQTIWMAHFSKI